LNDEGWLRKQPSERDVSSTAAQPTTNDKQTRQRVAEMASTEDKYYRDEERELREAADEAESVVNKQLEDPKEKDIFVRKVCECVRACVGGCVVGV
jgi:hypothetical protein